MSHTTITALGILLPFLGTALGAAMVFFLKNELKPLVQKALLGFAAGVMIAASVWSLLIPAIDMAEAAGTVGWLPAVAGFLLGIFFLLLLDCLIPHLHFGAEDPEGPKSKLGKNTMLILAVTLHNFPEGMAVGVAFAGFLTGNTLISVSGVFALAIGIAVQNFPEGAIISLPLKAGGYSRSKAFLCGTLSGIVEPIGAVIMILLTTHIAPVLPYILSFAAGAMLYVVIEELIPESQTGDHTNVATIGSAFGFALMMLLDVALG